MTTFENYFILSELNLTFISQNYGNQATQSTQTQINYQ